MTNLNKIYKLLDDMENDDNTIDQLEKAMDFYCGNYDICEGFKHAIRQTLDDQYQNHASEQDPKDLVKLLAILNTPTK